MHRKIKDSHPHLFAPARVILPLAMCILCACAAPAVPADRPTGGSPNPSLAPTVTPSLPAPASLTPEPAPSSTPAPLPTDPPQIPCSPLEGIPLDEIGAHITNPFAPPPPGSDDPHQGIDLAVFLPGTRIAVPGAAVSSVLPGRVAARVADRFPYGNALLVETALEAVQPQVWPTALPELPLHTSLSCPAPSTFTAGTGTRSLYVLYAHMHALPDLMPGDTVDCGQVVGAIGDSGNALNPHLHLEMRIGPAGAHIPGMAHYDASASLEEMDAYCAWRVSGWFQVVDPLPVLGLPQTITIP